MREGLHDLAGPYALEALGPSERRRFERHLSTCEDCRKEVRLFSETLARTSFELAEQPPAALRAQVLEAIAKTKHEVPTMRYRRWVLAGVAAALVAIVGGGILYAGSTGRQIAAIYRAPDAATVAVQASAGFSGAGTVAWSERRGQGVLALHGLGALPPELDYQVWVIGTGRPIPAGLFDPRNGRTEVLIQAPVFSGAVVAVTIEPAGGLAAPSGDPVLVAQL